MELKGSIATKIETERNTKLTRRFREREVEAERRRWESEAREARNAKIAERLLPFRLVEALVKHKVKSDQNSSARVDERKSKFTSTYPLKETVSEGRTYQASLLISGEITHDERKAWQPLSLGLRLHADQEDTEHTLTTIADPIKDHSGMPEDYGFRTYVPGKEVYEVSSYKPDESESQVIISAIKEAAELAGIYNSETGEITSQ